MALINLNRTAKKLVLRKLTTWFSRLSFREKMLAVTATCGVTLFCLYQGAVAFVDQLDDFSRLSKVRTQDYQNISNLLLKHNSLNSRLDKLKLSFGESLMTFEQVSARVDGIIKQIINDDAEYEQDYELKKPFDPEPFGDEFEKQKYSLEAKNLSLEHLINLLHELEHGESAFFMGKVDIKKNRRKETFRATLDITTIGKRRAS